MKIIGEQATPATANLLINALGKVGPWASNNVNDDLGKRILRDRDFQDIMRYIHEVEGPATIHADYYDAIKQIKLPAYTGITTPANASFIAFLNKKVMGDPTFFIDKTTYRKNWATGARIRDYVDRYYYVKYYDQKFAYTNERIPDSYRARKIIYLCWQSIPGLQFVNLLNERRTNSKQRLVVLPQEAIDYRLYNQPELIVQGIIRSWTGHNLFEGKGAAGMKSGALHRIAVFKKQFPTRLYRPGLRKLW